MKKRIFLAGAGHAHLELIKRLSRSDRERFEWILISPVETIYYSGLLPRWIAGQIDRSEFAVDAFSFARRHSIQVLKDQVVHYDPFQKRLQLQSGTQLPFDVLSLNVGSAHSERVADPHVFSVRPIFQFVEAWDRFSKTLKTQKLSRPLRFAVIGAGPAGVEIASALRSFALGINRDGAPEVSLFQRSDRVCPGYSRMISDRIQKELTDRKIKVHLNQEVINLSDPLCVEQTERIERKWDAVLIATPAEPPDFVLPVGDVALRSAPSVFAAGNCVTLSEQMAQSNLRSSQRSGVLAVHQGRYLAHAITDYLAGKNLKPFKPPERLLNILSVDRRTGLAVYGDAHWLGAGPQLLKSLIDRSYVRSFQI